MEHLHLVISGNYLIDWLYVPLGLFLFVLDIIGHGKYARWRCPVEYRDGGGRGVGMMMLRGFWTTRVSITRLARDADIAVTRFIRRGWQTGVTIPRFMRWTRHAGMSLLWFTWRNRQTRFNRQTWLNRLAGLTDAWWLGLMAG